MKFSRFDGEVELSAQDLEELQDPDKGPAMFGALEPDARRILSVALMPVRGVLIERFDTEPAPLIRISWVPDGSVAITRFDGDLVTVGETHMRYLPAILSAMLRIDSSSTPIHRDPVRTSVGEIDDVVNSLISRDNRDGTHHNVLGNYIGGWRCTGGWGNLPADRSMTVVTETDGSSWMVEVGRASSPANPFTEIELIPIAGSEILSRLRRIVVGTVGVSQPLGAESVSG